MDREKKKKTAAVIAALVYLDGTKAEAKIVCPSRWASVGREHIMLDRARVITRR